VISAWGRVIKAVHKELKFPLAIKIIQQTNKILQQSLQTEVEILKKCKSPLVVNYFGTILRDNEVWVRQNNRIFTRAYFWVLI
jgi:serine/threonine protein kinase